MSNKVPLIRSMQVPPVMIQKYERYLPTAFDESMSILEKINKVIHHMNEIGRLTEEMMLKWNEVYEWVMGEGLTQSVEDKLKEWLEDGTIEEIINVTIFGKLNDRLDVLELSIENVIVEFEVIREEMRNSAWYKPMLKGDNSENASTIIQSALNNYKQVFIGEGNHALFSELKIRRGTRLTLHPNARLIRKHDDNLITNHQMTYGGYNGEGNIIIEGGTLDVNGNSFPDVANGIGVVHGENIIIRDLTILNTPRGHALEITGCKGVLVDNVRFLGYVIDPAKNNYYVEAIQIESASAPPPNAGYTFPYVMDFTTSKDITVQNCLFDKSDASPAFPSGVGQHGARYGTFYTEIIIRNNRFVGCSYWAIRNFKFRDCLIEGNIIEDCTGGGIYIVTPSGGLSVTDTEGIPRPSQNVKGTTIVNNILKNIDGKGLRIESNEVGHIEDVIIANNTFNAIGQQTIHASYADRLTIVGNTIRNSDGRGILLEFSRNVIIDNNIFSFVKENAVFLFGNENVSVTNNHVKDVDYYGINVSQDNTVILISGNLIVNFSRRIEGQYDGLIVSGESSDVRVTNNMFRTLGSANKPRFGMNFNTGATMISRFGNDTRCRAITDGVQDNSTEPNTGAIDF